MDGDIWLGTRCLVRYDGEDFRSHGDLEHKRRYVDFAYAVGVDQTGQLWSGGLNEIARHAGGQFHTVLDRPLGHVRKIRPDSAGCVWMVSAGGLLRWDGGELERVEDVSDLGADLGMVVDAEDNLWIRSNHWEGLLCWDGRRLVQTDILPAGASVTAINVDGAGRVLIGFVGDEGAQIGIGRYDGSHLQVLFQQPSEDREERLAHVVEARDGVCWLAVGAYDGRKQFGRLGADGTVVWVSQPDDGLLASQFCLFDGLLEDHRGRLWAATWSGAFCNEGGGWRNMLAGAGLGADNVSCFCLHEDRQKGLWIGTEYGALHYDGSRFQLISSPHIKGPVRSILQDRDGHLWFAAADGAVRYAPTETQPRVRLLRVDADRTYEGVERLEVPASSGQVIFVYRGMSFRTQPRHMLYAHRLEGSEEDWQLGHEQRAVYADLAPGEYTFVVKAIDVDLNESEPASLALTVVPDPRIQGYVKALSDGGLADEFVGESMALRRVQAQLARTDLTVLILGETGTGKGLAAHTLHVLSDRTDGPFIQVNCGPCPRPWSRVSCSATRGAPSPVRHRANWARWSWPRAAPCSWTRSAICPWPRRSSCCACSRSAPTSGWEERRRWSLTPGWWPRPTAIWSRWSATARSAKTCTTACRCSPCSCRRCGSGGRISSCWRCTLPSAWVRICAKRSPASLARRSRRYLERLLEQTNGIIKGPNGAAALLGVAPSTLRSRLKKLGIAR